MEGPKSRGNAEEENAEILRPLFRSYRGDERCCREARERAWDHQGPPARDLTRRSTYPAWSLRPHLTSLRKSRPNSQALLGTSTDILAGLKIGLASTKSAFGARLYRKR